MSAKITKKTDIEVTFEIKLDEQTLVPIVASAYDNLRGRVKAAGFRPGKAPNAIVERELGSATIQNEVLEAAVNSSYIAAVQDEKLPVIASPEVKINKFVPYSELEFTATVEVIPAFELPDYKKIRKTRPEVKLDAKEIDQVIADLAKRSATRAKVERAAKSGDEVIIDYDGVMDGKSVQGASAKKQTLTLGSGNFIPGFEDELIGHKAGDKIEFTVTFPKEYHQQTLAGQPVTFTVQIHEVQEVQIPAIDDKLAPLVSHFKTLAELRASVEENIKLEKEEQAAKAFEQAILDELVAKTKLKAPNRLVQQQLGRLEQEFAQNLSYNGLDVDKYLQMTNKTHEQFTDELRPEAEKRVALAMILSEIARAEDLSVSQLDLDTEINRLKAQYTDPQIQAELAKPETREDVYNHLMSSRTIEKILSYVEAGK